IVSLSRGDQPTLNCTRDVSEINTVITVTPLICTKFTSVWIIKLDFYSISFAHTSVSFLIKNQVDNGKRSNNQVEVSLYVTTIDIIICSYKVPSRPVVIVIFG